MVKVLTERVLCACISATMVELSIPPDRNAPSGTSATICRRTASRSVESSDCASASSSSGKGSDYRRCSLTTWLEDVRAVLSTTPERWQRLVSTLSIDLLTRPPATGEWSALHCLQHLLDAERLVFPVRDGRNSIPRWVPSLWQRCCTPGQPTI